MAVTKKSLINSTSKKKTTKKSSPKAGSPVAAAKLTTAMNKITAYSVQSARII